MEYIDHTIKLPKESKEVSDFLSRMTEKVIAKDWIGLTELINEGKVALEGITQVDDEFRAHPAEVSYYLASSIQKAVVKK